jgi:hypothetical protein
MSTHRDPTQERTEGPTPHGGAYAVAYFSDCHGEPTPKDRAGRVEIAEFDADDLRIFRTYAAVRTDPHPR